MPCKGKTKSGKGCSAAPRKGTSYCLFHSQKATKVRYMRKRPNNTRKSRK